jgi:hypothetical protein
MEMREGTSHSPFESSFSGSPGKAGKSSEISFDRIDKNGGK